MSTGIKDFLNTSMNPSQEQQPQPSTSSMPHPLFCIGDYCFFMDKDKAAKWNKKWIYEPAPDQLKGGTG